MGRAEPFDDDLSFEDKVKCLPDEDLLEIWAESQRLETMLDMAAPGHGFPASSYELAIIRELAARAWQKPPERLTFASAGKNARNHGSRKARSAR